MNKVSMLLRSEADNWERVGNAIGYLNKRDEVRSMRRLGTYRKAADESDRVFNKLGHVQAAIKAMRKKELTESACLFAIIAMVMPQPKPKKDGIAWAKRIVAARKTSP